MELITFDYGLIFLFLVIGLATLFLWIIALISILRNEFPGSNDKLVWVLAVMFMPFIGSILYFLIGRNNRIKNNYQN